MTKLCGDSMILPLTLIFENCMANGVFSDLWNYANVTLFHKKDSRNNVKNYQLISLLPILAKAILKIITQFSISSFSGEQFIYWVLVTFFTWWFMFFTVTIHATWNSVIFWFIFRSSSSFHRYIQSISWGLAPRFLALKVLNVT